MRDMKKTTITIIVVVSIAILVGSLYGIIQIKKASAQESSNTGQSSVPVTHNILPETSNHATTLTPIHVTTTHHNITAASLNNGKLGPLVAKPTMPTVASAANAEGSRLVTTHINGLEVRNDLPSFDPKTQRCEGTTYALRHTSETGYLGCEGTIILQMVREGKNIPLNNNPTNPQATEKLPQLPASHNQLRCEGNRCI
jgi:hypothetical protein